MPWLTTIHRVPCAEPPSTCDAPGCHRLAHWWCCAVDMAAKAEPRPRSFAARCRAHAQAIADQTGAPFTPDGDPPRP